MTTQVNPHASITSFAFNCPGGLDPWKQMQGGCLSDVKRAQAVARVTARSLCAYCNESTLMAVHYTRAETRTSNAQEPSTRACSKRGEASAAPTKRSEEGCTARDQSAPTASERPWMHAKIMPTGAFYGYAGVKTARRSMFRLVTTTTRLPLSYFRRSPPWTLTV